MAPEGKSGLFVMVNAPALPLSGPAPDWAAQAQHLRDLSLRALDRAFPELSNVSFRVVGTRTPEDFARLGAPGGSLYGFLPSGQLGAFRRPRQRGPTPGLFYAGGGTHPGGGVPLVLLSGHFAAGLAAAHLGASS
jgi:phytoene dehydrogenase-like protein